ncbi:MAG: hypothetical protein HY323_05410 [Betaproteobacteria bacterium]|nr:hypothetical protein [Betaproteobacteria bacterium]
MTVTIYRRTLKSGLDVPVATIDAPTELAALERFAEHAGIDGFSLDATEYAYWLCPPYSNLFYYAYKQTVAA